jgi:acetyltransferase-like isoleucine patch superfamily enzyme
MNKDKNNITFLLRISLHYCGNFLRYIKVLYLRCLGIEIGKNTMISFRAKIDVRRGKVFIGDNCTITYGCMILSHDHAATLLDSKDNGEGSTIINNNVFIGVNSVILPNVTIGENSIIGAGSIVTRSIPPNVVAMGNPARVIKEIKK